MWKNALAGAFLLLSVTAAVQAEDEVCPIDGGVADAAEPGAAVPEIRGDRFIVKLKAESAKRADALPQVGLPRGIPELDALCEARGIHDGRRVIREHARPVSDWRLFKKIGLDRLYTLYLDEPNKVKVRQLVREFNAKPWVEYAEPVYIARATLIPNDPQFSVQWAHRNTGQAGGTPDADIDSTQAWDISQGSSSGVVAVLDTGVDLDHPDLVSNLIAGWDFVEGDAVPEDDNAHGTNVAGIAAARGSNAIGVTGVCPLCSIMPVKVLDSGGGGDLDDIADGVVFAADNGADAINMSLQLGTQYIQTLVDASAYAVGLGSLVMSSSGNSGEYFPRSPSWYPNVFSVGGTDRNDDRLYDYGDHLDLSAPGIDLRTTQVGGGYTDLSGTSAAVPLAAGVAALLRAVDPGLHVRELAHLLRLGADDQVGVPAEDTAGWDQFMGYGRLNAHGSLQLIDGPWLALDRPHYLCGGDLTVALKDESAGGSVPVTVTGSIGGDSETVTVTPVTAGGYYEGSIVISWAGNDGPVQVGDGKLDLEDGETITASVGALSATAFTDCLKYVCRYHYVRDVISGDCDEDGAADPGEIWSIGVQALNFQTEGFETVGTLETTHPDVEIIDGLAEYDPVRPFVSLSDDPFLIRVGSGAAVADYADLTVTFSGPGWEMEDCDFDTFFGTFSVPINRDTGTPVVSWDFESGNHGFSHVVAHGDGDLDECAGAWSDSWNQNPVSDKAHQGSFSMRLGTGLGYLPSQDAGLISPPFTVPAGGGAIGFYMWNDSDLELDHEGSPPWLADGTFAQDALILEAKERTDPTWHYLPEATYNSDQELYFCGTFPFGVFNSEDMWTGDGAGSSVTGDAFDREQLADISSLAGQLSQARFRFGANHFGSGQGLWIDTVTVYGPWVADSWTGAPPAGLAASTSACPTSIDLSWSATAGAQGYNVYRSETSCADAQTRLDSYDTTVAAAYSDTGPTQNVEYFYAVEALESGQGCPTERSCVSAECVCALPADPQGLLVDKGATDVLLTWDDPGGSGTTWNVYRDTIPNRALWGAPIATGVTDGDGGTPGIQHTDPGALPGASFYYLITATNPCGTSQL